jgi:hypothetical protein
VAHESREKPMTFRQLRPLRVERDQRELRSGVRHWNGTLVATADVFHLSRPATQASIGTDSRSIHF